MSKLTKRPNVRFSIGILATALVMASAGPAWGAEEPTSRTNAHLQRWLEKFPLADENKDGVLTASEVWAYQDSVVRQRSAARREREQAIARAKAAGLPPPPDDSPPRPAPDRENVRYGPHERNVLDFWAAPSSRPTPLVIYIHGGAWRINDKSEVTPSLIARCRAAGFSVASINYRYITTAPLPAPHQDSARALQFLRAQAKEWNLNPRRVAACGGSAGAGITLWLAFHDDMADPKSVDPVARESTRLRCGATVAGQCTYDPNVVRAWIGEPAFRHSVFPPAYGVKSHDQLADPKLQPLYDEVSAIKHLTRDDPPIFQIYSESDVPLTANAKNGQGMHHPIFGHKLQAAMHALGLECGYLHTIDSPADPEAEMVAFFRRHLGTP